MKRFSLRLTEPEYIKLKSYCEHLHISMNDVIRELIRDWNPTCENLAPTINHESNGSKPVQELSLWEKRAQITKI